MIHSRGPAGDGSTLLSGYPQYPLLTAVEDGHRSRATPFENPARRFVASMARWSGWCVPATTVVHRFAIENAPLKKNQLVYPKKAGGAGRAWREKGEVPENSAICLCSLQLRISRGKVPSSAPKTSRPCVSYRIRRAFCFVPNLCLNLQVETCTIKCAFPEALLSRTLPHTPTNAALTVSCTTLPFPGSM
jgi:hypothetical protein